MWLGVVMEWVRHLTVEVMSEHVPFRWQIFCGHTLLSQPRGRQMWLL